MPLLRGAENIANVAYRHESRKSLLDPDLAYPPGGYHHREGIVPAAGTGTIEGSSKMYLYAASVGRDGRSNANGDRPNTLWTWTFMLVTLAQAIVVLAIEA